MLGKNYDKLVLNEIYKDFHQGNVKTNVLSGINIEFVSGKTYAITGVSGSGKSTLLHIAGGLDMPTSGTVLFKDQNIFSLKSSKKEKLLNSKFGFVFQFHYLIKEFTVLENIIIVGLITGEYKKKCITRAESLLELMNLSNKRNSYPGQLSGGEQQRISIARAIFNKPAFLFADEPTGNLDHENAQIVVNLLLTAKNEWGLGVILCSHDSEIYKKMDNVFTLHEGTLTQK